jgi:hypothetical protein
VAGILLTTTKRLLPPQIRANLNVALNKVLGSDLQKVFLARLGIATDFSGYEKLIDYMEANKIYELKGDFLEVGAFVGGGSVKLARYANRHNKRLIVIDVFDPNFDSTENVHGQSMSSLYRQLLGRKNQREIFDKNTRFERNIVVYSEDSKRVKLPADTELCFSFIDGNHDPEYVKNDFHLAWNATVSGGVVGLHDYVESGGDVPQVTNAINGLIEGNKSTIRNTCYLRESAIMLIRKQ